MVSRVVATFPGVAHLSPDLVDDYLRREVARYQRSADDPSRFPRHIQVHLHKAVALFEDGE